MFKLDEFDNPICPFCDFPLKHKDDGKFDYYVCTGDCNNVYFDYEGDVIEDLDEYLEINDEPVLCSICDDIAKYKLFDGEYCAKCLVDVIEEDGNDEFVIDRIIK